MTCNCHVDDSATVRYAIILGRYILTTSVLNIELSDHVIKLDDGPLKGSTAPMVDMGTYESKKFNTGKLHLNNRLRMITQKKYTNWSNSIFLLNDYA